MNHQTLIGKSVQFEYSDETYRIDILNETSLRWTREKGENIGEGDEEKYVISRLSEDLMMLTWIEQGGPGLSNVLNFTKQTVTTHANMERDVFVNPGKLILSSGLSQE